MTPIPTKIRNVLARMPRMKHCEFTLDWMKYCPKACEGRVQYHHVWVYAGKQIQEVWAIVAVCDLHHETVKHDRVVREELEKRSIQYSTDEELAKYPKKNWAQTISYLFNTPQ